MFNIKTKQFLNKSNRKYILVSIVFIGLFIVFMASSFAASNPIKSVEVKSEKLNYDNNEGGSWKITRSAYWTKKGKARINISLETTQYDDSKARDVILIIDNSYNMIYNDFDNVKAKTITAITDFLGSNTNNRVALITFNSTATMISDFTNDLTSLTTSINSIETSGTSNYYNAFLQIENLLSNYTYSDSKSISAVFVSCGISNYNSTNDEAEYEYLKEKYSYLDVRNILYKSSYHLYYVKNMSDKQYLATNEEELLSSLNNSLFGALSYDNFVIKDTINTKFFSIDKVSLDGVSYDNSGVVTWDVNDSTFVSGSTVSLDIDVSLIDSSSTIYETNSSILVNSKINGISESVSSSLTPVISTSYKVIYDGNGPDGCSVTNVPSTSVETVFDSVNISSNVPVCDGYLFKGWSIVTSNVKKNNDSSFVMPEEDVNIKATWSKVGLNKLSDGTVSESISLYKVLEQEATSGGLAKEYTGNHQDSMAGTGTEKIYHYYASTDDEGNEVQNKNNVIFAGLCWQMLRTTDTGGVKMIYNGEPDVNGSCGTDRSSHVGYTYSTISDGLVSVSKSYYYATDFEYDSTTQKFTLSGDLTQATWSSSNYANLLGKYFCDVENSTTCTTLYYAYQYYDSTNVRVLRINDDALYSDIGEIYFNLDRDLPSFSGYMYNNLYSHLQNSSTSTYKFGSSFTYSNGKYTLSGTTKYWGLSEYSNDTIDDDLGNTHYTCLNSTGSCTSLAYIFSTYGIQQGNVSTRYLHYILLKNGKSVSDALDEMLSSNTYDSMMKKTIDLWYSKYMSNYTSYLEDTIFCQSRSIKSFGIWDPLGGTLSGKLEFVASTDDLSCSRETDKFSVSNEKAKLTYPVALVTLAEVSLLGNNNARKAANNYILFTPYEFWHYGYLTKYSVTSAGAISNTSNDGVRPVISLKPGTKYVSGYGTMDSPYIVETSSN